MKKALVFLLLFSLLLIGCEKAYDEDGVKSVSDERKVTLRVLDFEQFPFGEYVQETKASTALKNLCTRMNFAVFKNDEKLKSVNQVSTDAGFGTVELSLADGQYEVVVIAHNCAGNATLTQLDKITFPSNVVSDTFYYYGELTVSGEAVEMDLELKRAVAMVRFVLSDAMPENVSQMKFYYTGGSSTFDARSGYGCVNSKQTVKFDVTSDMKGKSSQFEVFTLPHDETGTLKLTVTALDANGSTVEERVFENVSVRRNYITQYTGNFFTGSQSSDGQRFTLKGDGEWKGQSDVGY